MLLLSVWPALAQENPTAYEALRVIGTQMDRSAVDRVISVTGVDGDPQPETWKILLEGSRRGGVREVEVAGGRIVSERAPARQIVGSMQGATIATARLNLDSSGAFAVASYTADKSHTVFSNVSYTLRTDERSNPIWIVTLQNAAGRPIGTIHIGANKGNVTRVEGLYAGTNMNQVQEDPVDQGNDSEEGSEDEEDEDEEDENAVKRRIKQMFHRSKEDARRMFGKVSRSFEDFFSRE